jgi:hypothetical protein
MITLIPIEPLDDAHGMLIVEAFNELFINRGGKQDGWGNGVGMGYGNRDGGNGGRGWGYSGKHPEEWIVKP